MKTVAVIGSGSWGTALAVQLKEQEIMLFYGLSKKKKHRLFF